MRDWLAIVIRPGVPPLELIGASPASLIGRLTRELGTFDDVWIISFQHIGGRHTPSDTPAGPVAKLE